MNEHEVLTFLDQEANWARRFLYARTGLMMETCELKNIFYLAYAAAKKKHIKGGSDRQLASFKTYLSKCIFNEVLRLEEEHWRDRMAFSSGYDMDGFVDEGAVVDDARILTQEMFDRLDDQEQLIAREMLCPSDAVVKVLTESAKVKKGVGRRGDWREFARAIQTVHGIGYATTERKVGKIQGIANFLLDMK